jgi:predicted ATPase/class 3 adenylate cyclase
MNPASGHQLTTVLFTDIVGYTAMMESDEEQALSCLRKFKQEMEAKIPAYRGKIIQFYGDGCLSTFTSSIEALTCAKALQFAFQELPIVPVRMGLHLGEVVFEDDNVYGAAVNIASRIESMGRPGSVLFSQSVHDQIKNKVDFSSALLGTFQFKNVVAQMDVFALTNEGLVIPDASELKGKGKLLDEGRSKAPAHNLPRYPDHFIGRTADLVAIKAQLASHRLVTLTGAGGAGKTRLSTEAAHQLLPQFPDGVWMIHLVEVRNIQGIYNALFETLSIPEDFNKDPLQAILEALEEKRILLLFDNCEHVIDLIAQTATQILHRTKHLRILATSREPLNIAGEMVRRVPVLSYPEETDVTAELVTTFEAAQLFCERAVANQQDFEIHSGNAVAIAGICRCLEGMPLALELAAARVRIMSPEKLLDRLSDRFKLLKSRSRTRIAHQQTLRTTIDWSYDLLSEEEQILFSRLWVFGGDFDLEAVEEIASYDPLAEEDILDLLQQLVEKSLVLAEINDRQDMRYKLLETMKEYGREKIEEAEANLLIDRFFHYYQTMAERSYLQQLHKAQEWLIRLEAEHANILAALDYFTENPKKTLMLAGNIGWFWFLKTHFLLGEKYLKKPLTLYLEKDPVRMRALGAFGKTIGYISFNEAIDKLLKEAIHLAEELNQYFDHAYLLTWMATLQIAMIGDFENGPLNSEKSLASAQKTKDPHLILHCRTLNVMAYLYDFDLDKVNKIEPVLEENIKEAQNQRMPYELMMNLFWCGLCALIKRENVKARNFFHLSMEEALRVGNLEQAYDSAYGIALTLMQAGDHEMGIQIITQINLRYLEDWGIDPKELSWNRNGIKEFYTPIVQTLDPELVKRAETAGKAMTWEEVLVLVRGSD